MSATRLKCPVCGEHADLIKLQVRRRGNLTRYKCLCRNCEGWKEADAWIFETGQPLTVLGRFEDLPFEHVPITHR